jgi:hypothetical protein
VLIIENAATFCNVAYADQYDAHVRVHVCVGIAGSELAPAKDVH